MKSKEIRQAFLDFFASKGHTVVASSSLVPHGDPTLLFTNAGMNQFKDVFLGFDKRPYTRATTSQKCVRAGGKHNDLENVGYTARHHTFFEMLGNFSFGDYFKHDAIHYAWELLTGVFKLPKDKLWVTVYAEDDEAYDIWTKEIGMPAARVVRIGDNKGARYASDNFWMMGDTGPCGPCTEIFYDHGEGIPGGPPGSPDEDGDRYIEIWNNVFMQFNRDEAGVMHQLPKPSVDTGMGLERISAVLQGVHSNYEIDLFQALIKAAWDVAVQGSLNRFHIEPDYENNSLKVIADHIRACSFLIADGVIPGNEGRGYVLRRIIRRAIRHGYKLGVRKPFFHNLVPTLVEQMGSAYPELGAEQVRVMDILKQEEERFFATIEKGMEILESALSGEHEVIQNHLKRFGGELVPVPTDIASSKERGIYAVSGNGEVTIVLAKEYGSEKEALEKLEHTIPLLQKRTTRSGKRGKVYAIFRKDVASDFVNSVEALLDRFGVISSADVEVVVMANRVLSGETAFKLHATYGFPLDLTQDVCREHGVTVDIEGFNAELKKDQEQARAAGKFRMAVSLEYDGRPTTFHGYEKLETAGRVLALYRDGTPVGALEEGELGVVVLDETPFYAESGGQVGDRGELRGGSAIFAVEDTQKIQASVFGHHGVVKTGTITVGNSVTARVDIQVRLATMRNHSVTHIMHKALREVLGSHVQQKGSLVNAERTRFDFAHNAPMTEAQIREVERKVNEEILANSATQARVMDIESAQKTGAMMLFGEKYGETVRVLDIGSSRELCGGTHVQRTGDIGLFKVVAETGVAAGVRRIEAVTGQNALAYLQELEHEMHEVAEGLKVSASGGMAAAAIANLQTEKRQLEKEVAALKGKLASSQGDDLAAQAVDVAGIKVLAATLDGADANALRETMDKLKDKLKSAAIVLASAKDGKVSLAAGVTADLTAKLKAGELVNTVALQVGGKGGGRPDMAMAGGTDAAKLPQALASVAGWVKEKLN